MLNNYVSAIQEHINECIEDLESLHQLLKERSWTRLERKGAERLLQILVESCIGVAKHWLKQQGKVMPNDAYSVFEKLTELQLISADERLEWQKVIGMRNAIVHDYLNLDEKVIRAIIVNQLYLSLQEFAITTSEKLRT
ncbi:MAG: type VII toxin-antitoxin system HepT family RNase toxin [Colwellia sp.]